MKKGVSVYISVHECFQFLLGRHDHDGGSLRREDMIEGGRGRGGVIELNDGGSLGRKT